MAIKTLTLSELVALNDDQKAARLNEFGASKPAVLNGEADSVNSRITRLETRYEKSSEQMVLVPPQR